MKQLYNILDSGAVAGSEELQIDKIRAESAPTNETHRHRGRDNCKKFFAHQGRAYRQTC